MPNSNGRAAFGRRSGTVTVIEEPVRRSAARTAKIAFYVVLITVGLLTATVLASKLHPILALFAGLLIGGITASVVFGLIIAWPVLRTIWWWATEILTATGLVVGWVEMAEHTTLPVRVCVTTLIIVPPAAIPAIRRRIVAVAWCVITRHRIRTCFSEFIITNRYGSLPLILLARPTPAGERVWIWLRPGLSLDDLQSRLPQIAVACWASSVTAEAASPSNAALIRLDIKHGDVLTATIGSPLLGLVPDTTPATERDELPVPTALDLPDVDAADVAPARPARKDTKTPVPVPAITPAASPGSDIEDWI